MCLVHQKRGIFLAQFHALPSNNNMHSRSESMQELMKDIIIQNLNSLHIESEEQEYRSLIYYAYS